MKFNLKQVQDKLSSFHNGGKYDPKTYFVRYQKKKVFLVHLGSDDELFYTSTSPILGLDLGEQSFQLPYATFMKLKNKDAEIIKGTLKSSRVLIDLDIDRTLSKEKNLFFYAFFFWLCNIGKNPLSNYVYHRHRELFLFHLYIYYIY
jgi:hypothetical protein